MRVGELARRAGVTVRALRYYEKAGLVVPSRLPNGYRDYHPVAVRQVREIRELTGLGLSVEQTRPFVECLASGHGSGGECPASLAAYRHAIDEFSERITRLVRWRDALAAHLEAAADRAMPTAAAVEATYGAAALQPEASRPGGDDVVARVVGWRLPAVTLPATDGSSVRFAALGAGRTVLFVYPLTGRPGVDLPDGWDTIPGARGCTAEAGGFRDHHEELREAGAGRIYGLSAQSGDYPPGPRPHGPRPHGPRPHGPRPHGPRPPAGVVFDLDGTLLDTMSLNPAAYADTIRALGGPDVSPADIVAAWQMGSTPVVLAHFLGRSTSVDDIECFYRHLAAAVAAVRPFPGVVEMVDTLSRAGYRLGVFTSATRRAATLMLSAAGLDGLFPTVVCGDEVSKPKPAPEGLRLACRYLGVGTAATAYVGDSEVDLQCAEAAGALPIHARWDARTMFTTPHAAAETPSDIVRLVRSQSPDLSSEPAGEPSPSATQDR